MEDCIDNLGTPNYVTKLEFPKGLLAGHTNCQSIKSFNVCNP